VRCSDGEMPVVAWVGGLGIDCRCFTSFLATVLQLCRSELAAVDPRRQHRQTGLCGQRRVAAGLCGHWQGRQNWSDELCR
jgi:hypothetical protein